MLTLFWFCSVNVSVLGRWVRQCSWTCKSSLDALFYVTVKLNAVKHWFLSIFRCFCWCLFCFYACRATVVAWYVYVYLPKRKSIIYCCLLLARVSLGTCVSCCALFYRPINHSFTHSSNYITERFTRWGSAGTTLDWWWCGSRVHARNR